MNDRDLLQIAGCVILNPNSGLDGWQPVFMANFKIIDESNHVLLKSVVMFLLCSPARELLPE